MIPAGPLQQSGSMPSRHERERPSAGSSGFSLAEIMVVMAILLVLFVLALPRFSPALGRAREAAAAATMRSVHTSQEAYRVVHGSYSSNFQALQSSEGGPVVPPGDDTGSGSSGEDVWVHNGYIFRLFRPTPLEYTITAEPIRDRDALLYFDMNQFGFIVQSGRPRGPGAGAAGDGEPPEEEPPTE